MRAFKKLPISLMRSMPASSILAVNRSMLQSTGISRSSLVNAPRYNLFNFNKNGDENAKTAEETKKETVKDQKEEEKAPETKAEEKTAEKTEEAPKEEKADTEALKAEKAELEKKFEELNAKLTETENALAAEKKKSDKYYSALSRAVADEENTRKIMKREMENMKSYAISKFAKDLLEVTDNLNRGLGSITEEQRKASEDLEQLYLGVDMTRGIMMKILGKHGVEEYNPLDEKFDPNVHEALCQVPDPTREPNTIADVIQTGFKIQDRVLRPAKVATVMATPGQTKKEEPKAEEPEKKSI